MACKFRASLHVHDGPPSLWSATSQWPALAPSSCAPFSGRFMIRSAAATAVVLLGALALAPSLVPTPSGASLNVVISQVYGGGGNTSAPFTHDFIELHNLSDTAVSVDGWSLQYASATGTGNLGANSG